MLCVLIRIASEVILMSTLNTVIFLGVHPASCTHNFARGRKKLASVSPVDSLNSRMYARFAS